MSSETAGYKNKLQENYHYSHYKSKPNIKACCFSLRGKSFEILLFFGVLQIFAFFFHGD